MNELTPIIWRDGIDKSQFWIGVVDSRGRYTAWGAIFVDGLVDLFGTGPGEKLRDLAPQTPMRLSIQVAVRP